MRRLVFAFLWFLVFVVLLLGVDQIFLHSPGFKQPFLRDIQEFHSDFRRRLFGLTQPQRKGVRVEKRSASMEPASSRKVAAVEALVQREIGKAEVAEKFKDALPQEDGVSYIYVDAQQNLQFAAELEEIPPAFRDTARPLTDKP